MTSAASTLDAFFAKVAESIGSDAVNRSEETLRRYGENTLPGADQSPSGVIYPSSTQDVQAI
ncbi:MAG TPA: hypothetical protein VJU34_13075, partial [Phenylobacterium sp.]|nr:hypothetical protein [Phenylobacterium sp.]